jgi:hypothetical protein
MNFVLFRALFLAKFAELTTNPPQNLFDSSKIHRRLLEWISNFNSEVQGKMSTPTILVLLVVIGIGAALIIVAPIVQIWILDRRDPTQDIKPDKKFELRDGARKTWIQIVGGITFLVGFYLTYQSLTVSQQAQETASETQFSNSFATATDDLAAADVETRLGGIYALERLAEDSVTSNDDRKIRQVIEVLCAYVRKHAPSKAETEILPSKTGAPDPPPRAPAADVQAILTVLGRQTRTPQYFREGIYLYPLYETDLRYADLHDADLRRVNLWRSNLQGADLSGAKLQGAYFGEANLQGANLSNANVERANLTGADLRQVKGLSQEQQIDQTRYGDQATLLPPDLQRSKGWGELDIPVEISLPAKEYFPNEFELMRSFRVDEGWTSEGQGRNYLHLAYGDAKLSFVKPQTVYDPGAPTEPARAPENSENLVAWFQKHPDLDAEKPVAMSHGDWSGKWFDTRADAPPGVGFLECIDPCVPIFPQMEDGRIVSRVVFFEGYKVQIGVSEVGGEPVVVTIQSPTNEFDGFLRKARRVLGTVEWKVDR